MARVHIEGTDLRVEIEGLDRLWAFRSSLTIPLAHVRGVTPDPGITSDPKGVRSGGTHVPRTITAGTFHQDGEKIFWDVRNAQNVVVIELRDDEFSRLVIEVDDPRAVADLVASRIAG